MSSIPYRPHIDGLRAIAVLAVIGYHAFPTVFPGGFVGVDVFFVISGYLITGILLSEQQGGEINIAKFYARRILRIFPSLILVLSTTLIAGWYLLLGNEYRQLGKHIGSGALFISNITLWFESSYFDNASATKPLLHLWSLGIEEQFYIVWPLVLIFLGKFRLSTLRWTVAIATASFTYSCFVLMQDQTASFYGPASRAWELLIGAGLACRAATRRFSSDFSPRGTYSIFGLALITLSIFGLDATDRFPGWLALMPVLGAAALMEDHSSRVEARLLSHPLMVGIGKISYPMYLWHWPLLSFATIITSGLPSLTIRLTAVCATFALALFSYQCLEKPVQYMPRIWTIASLVTTMAVLGLLGKNIYDRDGLADIRYKKIISLSAESNRDFIDWEKSGLITKKVCSVPFQFPGQNYCLTKFPERHPTAAVIGDSHAFHAYWGLAEQLGQRGQNLIAIGRGACLPLLDFARGDDQDKCQPHINNMIAYAADDPEVRSAYLVFRGRYLPNEASISVVRKFEDALDRTMTRLVGAGKEVYIFLPVVETGFDPRLCLGSLPFGRSAPQSCDISRSKDEHHTELLRNSIVTVLNKHPKVNVVTPNDYFCTGDICPVVRDGHSMFKDENHLSYTGSMFQGRAMDSLLRDFK